MLSSDVIDGTNIIDLTYDGGIDADETDAVRERMTQASGHGPLRILLDMRDVDLDRVEPQAVWDELTGAGLLADVDRAAVLTEMSALGDVVRATNDLPRMTVQIFAPGERDHAVSWLQS